MLFSDIQTACHTSVANLSPLCHMQSYSYECHARIAAGVRADLIRALESHVHLVVVEQLREGLRILSLLRSHW